VTADEATLRRVTRIFDHLAAWVPRRIADEEIGDALEEIADRARREGCSQWWLFAKVISTSVSVVIHAACEPPTQTCCERAGWGANMFDRYVTGRKPSWTRRSLLVASLGLHGAAAIALLVYSSVHVEEIAPPPLSVIFSGWRQPIGGGSDKPPSQKPEKKEKRPPPPRLKNPSIVQPTTTVAPPPATTDPRGGDGPPTDVGPHGPPGFPPGPPGSGPGIGPPNPTPIVAPPPKPQNIAAHRLDGDAIFHPDPHLPDLVKLQHKGLADPRFTAKVCVNQEGRVFQVHIVEGIVGGDESILSTIRTWQYKPQPIPVCFISSWIFQIR
jgi:hypothetical protein